MVLNPDHPAYSDQPDARDPMRECPHLVPYPRECADCVAEDRAADEETGSAPPPDEAWCPLCGKGIPPGPGRLGGRP
jgi:hypothetical protein